MTDALALGTKLNEHYTALRSKTGPTYESMVRGQLAYWIKEARRLGLDLAAFVAEN